MDQYKGTSVSRGIAVGKVILYRPFLPDLTERKDHSPIGGKIAVYIAALAMAESECAHIMASTDGESAAILAAHVDILRDPEIYEKILELLAHEPLSVPSAVSRVFTNSSDILASVDDELIRERSHDVLDVRNRILRILAGLRGQDISRLDGDSVIVARDLMPSDAISLDREKTAAIVTETGGETSHTAIIARSYGIPALAGVENITKILRDGERVIVDAIEGALHTGAGDDAIRAYTAKAAEYTRGVEASRAYAGKDAVTADGVRIDVGVNIQKTGDDLDTLASIADSAGLFRTEFLFMGKTVPPSEETQRKIYARVLETFGDKYVILRTIDIGGDKDCPAFNLPPEGNPSLGLRAIRLCLKRQDIFKTQLRAAFRASTAGHLWLMLPMVGGVSDIRRAKLIIDDVKRELASEGVAIADVKIGVMIEIPSIAVMADIVAEEADFASIGSNDLCQYTLAVDRMNPDVAEYYEPFHPAVLRLMKFAIDEFTKRGKPIGLCGEMGGNPYAAAVLIGFGIRKLSASPDALPALKKFIHTHSVAEMERCAAAVVNLPTGGEVKKFLERNIEI
jgi:phosphotransferase system enzyme I (PtsI)